MKQLTFRQWQQLDDVKIVDSLPKGFGENPMTMTEYRAARSDFACDFSSLQHSGGRKGKNEETDTDLIGRRICAGIARADDCPTNPKTSPVGKLQTVKQWLHRKLGDPKPTAHDDTNLFCDCEKCKSLQPRAGQDY